MSVQQRIVGLLVPCLGVEQVGDGVRCIVYAAEGADKIVGW
jgi:small neutral amino acid transporter SnatA (MarC family)